MEKRNGKFQLLRYVENFSSGMQLTLARDHRLFDRSLRDNNTVDTEWKEFPPNF